MIETARARGESIRSRVGHATSSPAAICRRQRRPAPPPARPARATSARAYRGNAWTPPAPKAATSSGDPRPGHGGPESGRPTRRLARAEQQIARGFGPARGTISSAPAPRHDEAAAERAPPSSHRRRAGDAALSAPGVADRGGRRRSSARARARQRRRIGRERAPGLPVEPDEAQRVGRALRASQSAERQRPRPRARRRGRAARLPARLARRARLLRAAGRGRTAARSCSGPSSHGWPSALKVASRRALGTASSGRSRRKPAPRAPPPCRPDLSAPLPRAPRASPRSRPGRRTGGPAADAGSRSRGRPPRAAGSAPRAAAWTPVAGLAPAQRQDPARRCRARQPRGDLPGFRRGFRAQTMVDDQRQDRAAPRAAQSAGPAAPAPGCPARPRPRRPSAAAARTVPSGSSRAANSAAASGCGRGQLQPAAVLSRLRACLIGAGAFGMPLGELGEGLAGLVPVAHAPPATCRASAGCRAPRGASCRRCGSCARTPRPRSGSPCGRSRSRRASRRRSARAGRPDSPSRTT